MRISDWSSDVCSSDLWFGPIVFVVATDSTDSSITLARDTVVEHGALTLAAYTTDDAVARKVEKAAERAGVSLSLNLTGGVFVNQTAAFSDFHGTGANPAANAALSDTARKSVVWGKSLSVRVDFGGCRISKKKKTQK